MANGHETSHNEDPRIMLHDLNASDARISTPRLDTRGKKLMNLRTILERDPKAADIKWSLFVAACHNYRYDSILKPFPPLFFKDGVKDIDSLVRVIGETPPLTLILNSVHDPDTCQIHDHVIDLLSWVLVSLREPYLKTVGKECFDSILGRVPCEAPIPKPNYIFQVINSVKSPSESKWKSMATNKCTLFAYHGTKLENFHSIIHYGLQQHMSKNSLFGKGIYLTSELSVSFPYSPSGYGWGGSKCGSELSCIALCELIDHNDFVKCQCSSSDNVNKNRARVRDSIGGEVPNKYYVVSNSEMVRVRYILVYSKARKRTNLKPSRFTWFSKHKLLIFFIGYGLFLTVIGIVNSNTSDQMYKWCLQKVNSLYRSLQ